MVFTIEAESGLDLAASVVEAGEFELQAAKRAQAATVRSFFMLVYFRLIKGDLRRGQRGEPANR
jgi:hypothetical protein